MKGLQARKGRSHPAGILEFQSQSVHAPIDSSAPPGRPASVPDAKPPGDAGVCLASEVPGDAGDCLTSEVHSAQPDSDDLKQLLLAHWVPRERDNGRSPGFKPGKENR